MITITKFVVKFYIYKIIGPVCVIKIKINRYFWISRRDFTWIYRVIYKLSEWDENMLLGGTYSNLIIVISGKYISRNASCALYEIWFLRFYCPSVCVLFGFQMITCECKVRLKLGLVCKCILWISRSSSIMTIFFTIFTRVVPLFIPQNC